MAQEYKTVITPIGRWIWGDPFTRALKDYDGNDYEDGKGPYQMGFAIEKANPEMQGLFEVLYGQATGGYANNQQILQRIQAEFQQSFAFGNFKFKVKDGDKPNAKGTVNENAKGCWVLTLSTTFQMPKACHLGMGIKNAMGQPIADNQEIPNELIKRGYYVDVSVSVKINEKTDNQAGIYINPNVIRLRGVGPEISGGMSTEEAFGSAPATNAYVPAGMSTTLPGTVATGGVMPGVGQQQTGGTVMPGVGGAAGFPNAVAGAGGAIMPGATTQQQSTTVLPTSVQPHTGFVMPGMTQ